MLFGTELANSFCKLKLIILLSTLILLGPSQRFAKLPGQILLSLAYKLIGINNFSNNNLLLLIGSSFILLFIALSK
jgi:hypothetical protein